MPITFALASASVIRMFRSRSGLGGGVVPGSNSIRPETVAPVAIRIATFDTSVSPTEKDALPYNAGSVDMAVGAEPDENDDEPPPPVLITAFTCDGMLIGWGTLETLAV